MVRAKAARRQPRARPCRPDPSTSGFEGEELLHRAVEVAAAQARIVEPSEVGQPSRLASELLAGLGRQRPEARAIRCCFAAQHRAVPVLDHHGAALRRLGDTTQQCRGRPIGRDRLEQHGSPAGQAFGHPGQQGVEPHPRRSRSSSGVPSAVRSWAQTVARRRNGLRGSTTGQTAIRSRPVGARRPRP